MTTEQHLLFQDQQLLIIFTEKQEADGSALAALMLSGAFGTHYFCPPPDPHPPRHHQMFPRLSLALLGLLLLILQFSSADLLEEDVPLSYVKKARPQGPLRFGKRKGPSGPLRFGKRGGGPHSSMLFEEPAGIPLDLFLIANTSTTTPQPL
ncbi:unnamed protein product, partial [Mesorhabditis spiculigera]